MSNNRQTVTGMLNYYWPDNAPWSWDRRRQKWIGTNWDAVLLVEPGEYGRICVLDAKGCIILYRQNRYERQIVMP